MVDKLQLRTLKVWTPLLAIAICGCPIEEQYIDTDNIPNHQSTNSGEPPKVTIDGPDQATDVVELSGKASDPDQPAITLVLQLHSSLDGQLWKGNPNADKSWTWGGQLTPGTHEIEAIVRDANGNSNSATHSVQVASEPFDTAVNLPPKCQIDSPAHKGVYKADLVIEFSVDASDPEADPLDIVWNSNIDGEIGTATKFSTKLSPGLHQIEVEVSDNINDPCTDAVQIQVVLTN